MWIKTIIFSPGLNRLIHYHILNKFKNSTDLFHINAEDGTIILKKKLDYEKERVHDFVILASDNGVPSLSATSRMWIHVQDRNDNPPYFEQSSYNCFLSEEAQRGQFVSMVVAFDPDADDQAKLTYAIVAGNDQQVFSINEKTGAVLFF